METDSELQRKVLEELRWDPRVNAAHIGVTVKDGIVTLTGHVSSYAEKYAADQAAKRVSGVKAVANELDVKLPGKSQRTDADIATDAVNELTSNTWVPADSIKVTVSNGWIKLEGDVEWEYQKEAAENSVRFLAGVTGVTNLIRVKPKVAPKDLKPQIQDAFKRSAARDAQRVKVEVQGSKVILRGTVRSWAERQEAEQAAWSAPGVSEVDNQIIVSRPKPAWVWLTCLLVVFALLVTIVAWPKLLFHDWLGTTISRTPPVSRYESEGAPVERPDDLRIEADPDAAPKR